MPVIDENINTIKTVTEKPVIINNEVKVDNIIYNVINKVVEVDMPIDYVNHKI